MSTPFDKEMNGRTSDSSWKSPRERKDSHLSNISSNRDTYQHFRTNSMSRTPEYRIVNGTNTSSPRSLSPSSSLPTTTKLIRSESHHYVYDSFRKSAKSPLMYQFFTPPTSFAPHFEKFDPFEAALTKVKAKIPPGYRENSTKNGGVYKDRQIVCVTSTCHAFLYCAECSIIMFTLLLITTCIVNCAIGDYCPHAIISCLVLIPFFLVILLLSTIFQVLLSLSIVVVFKNEEKVIHLWYKFQCLCGCVEIPYWKRTIKFKEVKDFVLQKSLWTQYGKRYNVYMVAKSGTLFKISDTKDLRQQRALVSFLKDSVEEVNEKKSSFF